LWSLLLNKPGSLEKAFAVRDIFGEFESRNALNDALEWLYAKSSTTNYLATSLVNFLSRLYGFGFLYPKRTDLDSTCRLTRFSSYWNRATWRQLTISVWEWILRGAHALLLHLRAQVDQFRWQHVYCSCTSAFHIAYLNKDTGN
jgi:hypothetical protein